MRELFWGPIGEALWRAIERQRLGVERCGNRPKIELTLGDGTRHSAFADVRTDFVNLSSTDFEPANGQYASVKPVLNLYSDRFRVRGRTMDWIDAKPGQFPNRVASFLRLDNPEIVNVLLQEY